MHNLCGRCREKNELDWRGVYFFKRKPKIDPLILSVYKLQTIYFPSWVSGLKKIGRPGSRPEDEELGKYL